MILTRSSKNQRVTCELQREIFQQLLWKICNNRSLTVSKYLSLTNNGKTSSTLWVKLTGVTEPLANSLSSAGVVPDLLKGAQSRRFSRRRTKSVENRALSRLSKAAICTFRSKARRQHLLTQCRCMNRKRCDETDTQAKTTICG